jgi:hypothetical protein
LKRGEGIVQGAWVPKYVSKSLEAEGLERNPPVKGSRVAAEILCKHVDERRIAPDVERKERSTPKRSQKEKKG